MPYEGGSAAKAKAKATAQFRASFIVALPRTATMQRVHCGGLVRIRALSARAPAPAPPQAPPGPLTNPSSSDITAPPGRVLHWPPCPWPEACGPFSAGSGPNGSRPPVRPRRVPPLLATPDPHHRQAGALAAARPHACSHARPRPPLPPLLRFRPHFRAIIVPVPSLNNTVRLITVLLTSSAVPRLGRRLVRCPRCLSSRRAPIAVAAASNGQLSPSPTLVAVSSTRSGCSSSSADVALITAALPRPSPSPSPWPSTAPARRSCT